MRRSIVAMSVAGALASAVILAPVVEARVGGGGSSGSRGSRSYSAPRAPSSPGIPSTPGSRPIAPAGPTVQPQRPGGLFGGLGGMLGGLLVGGLLGSLLFGGLGAMRPGIGLLEILLMAGVAYFVISYLRRRSPVPAAPAGYASPAADPGLGAPAAQATAVRGAGTAAVGEEDLEQGIANIRAMDAGFDPVRFVEMAKDLFVRLQIGWSGGDLAAVRAHLTDEMATALEADLARLRERGRRNRVEQVTVESATLTEAWQEYGRDLATVHLRASAIDYSVDEATVHVAEGSRTAPVRFEEYWTLVRPVGPNAWRLGAIQQPPA
jgi:predicted lipid-binding transport protein (Tim44 family)